MHTAHVVALGFGAIPKHISYCDLTSHQIKLSTQNITQVLMDLGYELSVGNSRPCPIPPLSYTPH